jgi:hypothetical protein
MQPTVGPVGAVDSGSTVVVLLRDYAPLVTFSLVIFGWVVTNWLAARRERRKLLREHIAHLQALLDTLENDAIKYHTSRRDAGMEGNLIRALTRLESGCGELKSMAEKGLKPVCNKQEMRFESQIFTELRQNITYEHFAEEHCGRLSVNKDPQIQSIRDASAAVLERLRHCFHVCID